MPASNGSLRIFPQLRSSRWIRSIRSIVFGPDKTGAAFVVYREMSLMLLLCCGIAAVAIIAAVVMVAPVVTPPVAAAASAAVVPRSNLDIVTQVIGTQHKSVPPKRSSIHSSILYRTAICCPVQSRSILVILP